MTDDQRDGSDPADVELDMRGHECPWPILETRRTLKGMDAGQIVRVLSTDPHSVIDFKAFCARTGHELLTCRDDGAVWEFRVRKVAP